MKGLKCGGNMYVILVYDINLEEKEGQKVLRKVFKTCKKLRNSDFGVRAWKGENGRRPYRRADAFKGGAPDRTRADA